MNLLSSKTFITSSATKRLFQISLPMSPLLPRRLLLRNRDPNRRRDRNARFLLLLLLLLLLGQPRVSASALCFHAWTAYSLQSDRHYDCQRPREVPAGTNTRRPHRRSSGVSQRTPERDRAAISQPVRRRTRRESEGIRSAHPRWRLPYGEDPLVLVFISSTRGRSQREQPRAVLGLYAKHFGGF